jgi:hypothetical protein
MNNNTAFEVRDNAVHEWRTLTEIAADEGVTREELETLCLKLLSFTDMEDVYIFDFDRHPQ